MLSGLFHHKALLILMSPFLLKGSSGLLFSYLVPVCKRWAHMPFCWFRHEAAQVSNASCNLDKKIAFKN